MTVASAEKVSKGILMLEAQGHLVAPHVKCEKLYWEIDCRIWATGEEVERLADGVYSFAEFQDVYIKRGEELLSTRGRVVEPLPSPTAEGAENVI